MKIEKLQFMYNELEKEFDDCIKIIADVRANLPDVPDNKAEDLLSSSFAYNIKLYVMELEQKLKKYENS